MAIVGAFILNSKPPLFRLGESLLCLFYTVLSSPLEKPLPILCLLRRAIRLKAMLDTTEQNAVEKVLVPLDNHVTGRNKSRWHTIGIEAFCRQMI
jgi:hypothetical protein